MENTIRTYNVTCKQSTLLTVLLAALLLLVIAFLHLQYKTTPVTIPQAAEMKWSADTAWVRGWE